MPRRARSAALIGALALLCFATPGAGPALARGESVIGPDSGLPVPRFAALAGERVNGRRGPGRQHRIDWIYQRAGLPVLITAESGAWRRVRDPGGAEVWVHSANVENKRTVFVRGGRLGSVALRRQPRGDSRPLAYLERGVVGKLEACRGEWRQITIEDRTGWAEADALWGADSCAGPAGD